MQLAAREETPTGVLRKCARVLVHELLYTTNYAGFLTDTSAPVCLDSVGIISKTSRGIFFSSHSLGKTSLIAQTPGGLQLDPKYLSEYPGVLIISDCCSWPQAA